MPGAYRGAERVRRIARGRTLSRGTVYPREYVERAFCGLPEEPIGKIL